MDKWLSEFKPKSPVIKKLDYRNREIYLNIDSSIEDQTRLHSCAKEPETVRWIETFFKEGDVFFDIGANVGAYSLVAAKFFNGKVRVFAFEPSFLNFAQLNKNILINQCQASLTPLQVALSDHTALSTFNYSSLIPGGAFHAVGNPLDYQGNVFKPVYQNRVLAYRLDDLLDQFALPLPNHLKIDVDGIEFDILKGAEKTLSHPFLRSILIEIDEGMESSARVVDSLTRQGFCLHSKHKYTPPEDRGPFSGIHNYIFYSGNERKHAP